MCLHVQGKLLAGAMKSARREENIRQVMDFCETFELMPFDDAAAWAYGEIKSSLERKGIPIEFNRIEGLMLEDWT